MIDPNDFLLAAANVRSIAPIIRAVTAFLKQKRNRGGPS
jgi:hypothetical protein